MLQRIASAAQLLELTDQDVWVRGSLRRAFVDGWHLDGAVGWVGVDNEEQQSYLSVLGDAHPGADLLEQLMTEVEKVGSRVTTQRPVLAELRNRGIDYDGGGEEWEYRWTRQAAPVTADIGWITDDQAIGALLDEHAPKSSARPGDAHVRRWAGGYDDGRLVAVAADTTGIAGVGHISSVATATERRGQGWGANITSWVTGQLLAEGFDVVTLGMYGGNDVAIRLYERIGFMGVHRFASGRLVRLDP